MRHKLTAKIVLCGLIVALNACTNIANKNRDATYTKDKSVRDGAPRVSIDVTNVADAKPRPVVRTSAGNKSPYVVFGKRYTVLANSHGFRQQGNASWYGTKFHGKRTSNGEIYNMYAMTAAHKNLPIPSYVRVTNLDNQRSVIVRVNDRGPFHNNRIIDLSYAAAKKLGYIHSGVAPVIVEDVTPRVANTEMTATEGTKHSPAAVLEKNIDDPVVDKDLSSTTSAPAYLQVGAFRERQTAEQLRTKLMTIVNYPVAIARSYDAWYRVRIGPVHTEQSIVYLSHDLKNRGHANPIVVYE